MEQKNNPKLSIVVTARNDNYGGNLENRIKTFFRVIAFEANKNELQTEVVFVEYNPLADKPLFADTLNIKTNKYLTIKYIIVPNSFHQKINTSSKIPLLEYVAKNIGTKRAQGEYILVTNPDILFPEELFEFIKSDKINKDHYYRVDRNDIWTSYFDENMPIEQILETAKKNVYVQWVSDGVRYKSWKAWFSRFIHSRNKKSLLMCPIFNKYLDSKRNKELIHDKAAGDFILMHRDNWNKVGGFDETPHNMYLDSYIIYVLTCFNLQQTILSCPIYHIQHDMGRAGRPGVAYEKFKSDAEQMLKTKIPYRQPDPNWGFTNEDFKLINH